MTPTRHKGLRETNGYWAFTVLPKPCQCEVQTFSTEDNVKPGIQTLFKLEVFHQECERLKKVFARLHNPETLIENTIRHFIEMKVTENACVF